MDKHIAMTTEANQRGKIAAEQAIIDQRKREAAARAEVTRELAGYGACPYRRARETAQEFPDADLGWHHAAREQLAALDKAAVMHLQRLEGPHGYKPQAGDPHSPCTCRDPRPGTSGVEDRPYAHDRGCRRNYGQFSGTPDWRTEHGKLTGESTARARPVREGDLLPDPALTPEQEIRAALGTFDDWMLHGGPQVPAWMEPGSILAEPGRCRECHLGHAAVSGGLCTYCQLRTRVTRASLRNQPEPRRERGMQVVTVLCLLLAAVGFWLALYLIWTGALTP
jgi:hypothetical protein